MRPAGIALAMLLLVAPAATAQDIRVIDGDTFEMDGETIRLIGVVGFEPDQSCWGREGYRYTGRVAMDYMRELLSSPPECVSYREDDDGATLAVCRADGDEPLNSAMVRAGLAWSDPADGTPSHQYGIMRLAEARGVGVWSEGVYCLPPWDWSAYDEEVGFPRGIDLIDGDTFRVNGQVIRLWGIDALETGQTCLVNGNETAVLSDFATVWLGYFLGFNYRCDLDDSDQSEVASGRCFVFDDFDIGELLVETGTALADPQIGHPPYIAAQTAAEEAGKGYWRDDVDCVPPWEWREAVFTNSFGNL